MTVKKPKISLVVAMAEKRVIGRLNTLPWHIPEDLKQFKKITMGKPIVMGRKTFDSIGRPLPGRTNIVISRDANWTSSGTRSVQTVDQAIEIAASEGTDEIMVIGGAQIYEIVMPRADRIYLTEVHAPVDGDAFFPAYSDKEWREVSREHHDGSPDFSFIILDRVRA